MSVLTRWLGHKMRRTDLSTPIPDGDLLYLVSGHRDADHWGTERWSAVHEFMIPRLREVGIEIKTRRSILDFGCGCGRILAGWEGSLNGATLRGVDINPKMIAFCQDNIAFAETALCGAYPPLDYAAGSFDLVYAISVWTHMTLPAMVQWAGEMARIIASGGVLIVSYHGTNHIPLLAALSHEGSRQLEEHGYYVHRHNADAPLGSNDYATFATSAFIRSLFRGFELLRLHPGILGDNHLTGTQDMAIFQRRAD